MTAEDLLIQWISADTVYLVDTRISVIGSTPVKMGWCVRHLRLGRVHRKGRKGKRYVHIKPRNAPEHPKTKAPVKRSS